MAKYIGVQVPLLAGSTATGPAKVDDGTTDAATLGKLTDSSETFITAGVAVGDYAVITTGISGFPVRTFSKITAVDSETVLSISGAGNAGTVGTPTGLSAIGTVYAIIAAADVSSADLSGGGFEGLIKAGDMLLNTTTNKNYMVTNVISDTKLELDVPGAVIVGDDFFLLSDRDECSYKIRVDNATMMRGDAGTGQTTIHYKKLVSTNAKLALGLGDAPSSDFDVFSTEFKSLAQTILESKWRDVTMTMPYVSSDGTQGLQWVSTFTWSA